MSLDPMDHETHAFADKCEAICHEARRLEKLCPDLCYISVHSIDTTTGKIAEPMDCEVHFEIDTHKPLWSFAQQVYEILERAKLRIASDEHEALERAAEQPEGQAPEVLGPSEDDIKMGA